jgi:hypothetical protein
MLAKRKAWRQWKASPNPTTKLSFNHATRQLKQSMRRFLADQENQLLAAGRHKFFTFLPSYTKSWPTGCQSHSAPSVKRFVFLSC